MNVPIGENQDKAASPKARSTRRRAGRTGCSVEATLSVIGGVWKPVLLFHLLGGRLRFNALCRLTPNATQRMITLQLRELEADGIVARIVYPEVPPRVEYELTPLGHSLKPVLLSMRSWGADFQASLEERGGTAPSCKGEDSV
ncbi:helix-turn-helix domain-containing protein [Sphingopyxis soli]|jgi:DNA-binding HxlR family transcriptional regulator|uniref:Helix-turn-helix domain-containing protein n=1 Tax=Sphingopyxis soli TaxID=592051 RepID=A0ABN1LXV2_9SPHN|nr:helix-turn-helix domain-containing protein [Sphingopyxis soli]